jgi:hypothetical protein
MIHNVTAFIQWSLFTIGLIVIGCASYVGYYFRPIADVSLLHCAGVISQEAELVTRIAEMDQRENDLEAREQSLPVCQKKNK